MTIDLTKPKEYSADLIIWLANLHFQISNTDQILVYCLMNLLMVQIDFSLNEDG